MKSGKDIKFEDFFNLPPQKTLPLPEKMRETNPKKRRAFSEENEDIDFRKIYRCVRNVENQMEHILGRVTRMEESLQLFMGNTLPASDSDSTKILSKSDLTKTILDSVCLPFLCKTLSPSQELETYICAKILKVPREDLENQGMFKPCISKIKEWFRKKREYIGHRIYYQAGLLYRKRIVTSEDLATEIQRIEKKETEDTLKIQENLAMTNIDIAIWNEFCLGKLHYYLIAHGKKHIIE